MLPPKIYEIQYIGVVSEAEVIDIQSYILKFKWKKLWPNTFWQE